MNRRTRYPVFKWLLLIGAAASLNAPDSTAQEPRFAPVGWSLADQFADLTSAATDWFKSGGTPAPVVGQEYIDFDQWIDDGAAPVLTFDPYESESVVADSWTWQPLPNSLLYKSYLAGTKESRLSGVILHENDDSSLLAGTLGGRFGVLRYGNRDPLWPEGWQLDIEGSAQIRLDIPDEVDLRSADYRAGVPLTFARGRHRTKLAYYHLSSHLGDEFLLKHPGYPRLNFARDALVLGHTIYLLPTTSVYAEAAWAFFSDVSEEWEFQFGLDHAPALPTGFRGAPFFAVNGHLREEVDFGGALTVQTGWAWRSDAGGRLLRAGLHYYNGKSNQFSFFNRHEQQWGFGLWYDF